MIIAVCGNLASGKSTFAKYINKNYDFYYVPYNRTELSFLKDFFDDIPEKFLQTQLAFLTNKASQIRNLLNKGKNIVIDRSLEEDIHVFAELWINEYNIDERVKKLYLDTASYIVNSLPVPDLYIICDCPPEISRKRLTNRPKRDFEDKYPPNHIEKLYNYIQNMEFPESTYIKIDSAKWDFTLPDVMEEIMLEIKKTISCYLDNNFRQLSLFNYRQSYLPPDNLSSKYIIDYHIVPSFNISHIKHFELKKKNIYLAAPFTALTTPQEELLDNNFQAANRNHGVLPKRYQRKLEKIRKQIMSSWDVNVILPHKDVNQWGHIDLSSDIIIKKIIENVSNCDCVVAIPSTSIGVHLELGIAIAQRKPIIIFEVKNLENSFYVPNLDILNNIRRYSVNSIDDIPQIIQQADVIDFIIKSMEVTTNEIY